MLFLAWFEWKVFKRFSFKVIFNNLNDYSGKTKCGNDLKFLTKISGLNQHQTVHLSGKNSFSPIMWLSKKPQWSPFKVKMCNLVKSFWFCLPGIFLVQVKLFMYCYIGIDGFIIVIISKIAISRDTYEFLVSVLSFIN
jgi:hypothetical protein